MKKGFTLLELLITVFIFSIIMIMVYSSFTSFNKTSKAQEDLMILNQNLQSSLVYIERLVRMAGFGTVYSMEIEGKNINSSYYSVLTSSDGGSSGDDSLTVVLADRIYGQVAANPTTGDTSYTGNIIYVSDANTDLLDNSLKKYVFISSVPYNKFYELSSSPTTTSGVTKLTLSSDTNIKVNEGDYVYDIRAITVSYDSSGQQIEVNDNLGSPNQPVASRIEALQFQYGIDEDDDGTFDDTDSDGDPLDDTIPSGKAIYVKLIKVSILGRTPNPDPNYKDSNSTYTIANKTITLDNNDSNGINSTYDVHYRRKLITVNIMPRNLQYEVP